MDLLASYADDGSNTPNRDSYDKISESTMSQLEAEWESFEKMMGDDVMSSSTQKTGSQPVPSSIECPTQQLLSPTDLPRSTISEKGRSESSKDEEDEDSVSGSSSGSSDEDDSDEEDDKKDGRKRSYSVSSASSAATSTSDKSSVSKHSSDSDKASEGSFPVDAEHPDDVMVDGPVKTDSKVDGKRSRSRSASHSPSRKHRRSSEHSRCSHSRERHRHLSHSRRERKRSSHHSRSRSRDRHSHHRSSRDRHHCDHRRRHRSGSRSHDSHHRRRRHHSSSRKHSRRHSPDRKKSSHRRRNRSPERLHSRKNSSSEAGGSKPSDHGPGDGPRKTGPSVTYRTAGVKFHREAGSAKPMTFKEQMKQQILQSAKLMSENAAAAATEGGAKPEIQLDKPNLPLNPMNIYGNLATTTAGCGILGAGTVTPQMAFLQTVAALHKQAQEMTGVEVPKYYNPAAVNPLKYAEQVQKRKLLWSKSKEKKETNSQWNAQLVTDGDSKTQAKFKKLMGIKDADVQDGPQSPTTTTSNVKAQEQRQKQEELFHQLDREYEFARMATHTHRGVGLGFGSQMYQHH